MARSPSVSIVLTTYRRPHLVGGAIESCLSQTWEDLEIVVVDDGSGDETGDVVESYRSRDGRVRLISQPVNGGQCRALNDGFAACRGRLLTWTSDDNRFKPRAVERLVAALDGGTADLVFADFENVTIEGEVINVVRLSDPDETALYQAVGVCFMYTRDLYEAVGDYDVGLRCSADIDYWIRAHKDFTFEHVAEVLYENAQHPGSVTETHRRRLYVENARILRRHGRTRTESRREYARWIWEASRAARRSGKKLDGVRLGILAAIQDSGYRSLFARSLYQDLCPAPLKSFYRSARSWKSGR